MHSKPKIVNSSSLSNKVYVEFYLDDLRVREYSGKNLGLKLSPNSCKNLRERTALLNDLCRQLTFALNDGSYKRLTTDEEPVIAIVANRVETVLKESLSRKTVRELSDTYKRDLVSIHKKFIEFLTEEEKQGELRDISQQRVEQFLAKFNSSNTYYMNKRTDLAALFSTAGRVLGEKVLTVRDTECRVVKGHLNIAYSKEQIKPLLAFLKEHRPKLYICCIFTYSSWLRPHVEIRGLIKEHFNEDYSTITLAGKENKGGRVRVVFVPEYARQTIREVLNGLHPKQNIFTGTEEPFNKDYFKTAWNRIKKNLEAKNLIQTNQTIYSFRHTAAVLMYKKTKDIYLLQKLLGHSSVTVTQRYLRSLGEVNIEELRNAAPEL